MIHFRSVVSYFNWYDRAISHSHIRDKSTASQRKDAEQLQPRDISFVFGPRMDAINKVIKSGTDTKATYTIGATTNNEIATLE